MQAKIHPIIAVIVLVAVVLVAAFVYSRYSGSPTPTLGPESEPPREVAPGRPMPGGPPMPGRGGGGPQMPEGKGR